MKLSDLRREAAFLLKDRGALAWLALGFFLSLAAVSFGIAEVRQQRGTIEMLLQEDAADRADALAGEADWGGAAYGAFHLTYAPPSDFAFAALGQRDSSPWKHRVRMLALEGQIHESDTKNPDFALVGRFDFAFLAASVIPLLLILLLYDLRATERVAGRHDLLVAAAGRASRLWRARALVRVAALALLVLIPLWVTALIESSAAGTVALASLIVVASLLFWWLVVELVSRIQATPAILLTSLIGVWLALAIVVPALSKAVIEAGQPAPDGSQILLLQREAVNNAWDLPKAETMDVFIATHPEWADRANVELPFEWKWYFAFQQVGDQKAADVVAQYRGVRQARDGQAALISWLSPPSLVERSFEKLARTDAASMLAYDDAIRAFHRRLRDFYYPLLFDEEPYDSERFMELPDFTPANIGEEPA